MVRAGAPWGNGALGPEGMTTPEKCWDPSPWGKKTESKCGEVAGTGRLGSSSQENNSKDPRCRLCKYYELERAQCEGQGPEATWSHNIIHSNSGYNPI